MGKARKNHLKLPKRLLGVKLPKKSRKSLNALLGGVPSSEANPLVGAVIGSFVTMMTERLEQPLRDLIEAQLPADKRRSKERPSGLSSQAHH